MYPIKFKPVYIEKIWGGQSMNRLFKRELPFERTGESLDICINDSKSGIILNGIYKNMSFYDIFKNCPEKYIGRSIASVKSFPFILKLIDAKEDLSIQVHPSDEFALKYENCLCGKSEAWYILDAPENAKIIAGIKEDVTKEILSASLETSKIKHLLKFIPVKKGDVINIPSGLIHSITKGITLMEIQQNSCLTYRLYDYDRLLNGEKRELNIKKALEAIDYGLKGLKNPVKGLKIKENEFTKTFCISNPYFSLIKYEFDGSFYEESNPDKFFIITLAEGKAKILYQEGCEELHSGESVFIPACMGKYAAEGKGIMIKTMVSHREKDVLKPLLSYGYTIDDIIENIHL